MQYFLLYLGNIIGAWASNGQALRGGAIYPFRCTKICGVKLMKKAIDIEENRVVRDVPTGAFIRRVRKDGKPMKAVYVLGEYDRSLKCYEITLFYDISVSMFIKADTIVNVGFDF